MADALNAGELANDVHQALRAWHTPGGSAADLLEPLLLVQEQRATLGEEGSPAGLRLATNQVLAAAIDELARQDQMAAQVLRARFADGHTLIQVGHKFNVSSHTISRIQREAIAQVAAVLLEQERETRERQAQRQEALLPPPSYSRLFGLDEVRRDLQAQLLEAAPPWVTVLVGIGGIGKTALADRLVRTLVRAFYFKEVVWVRVEPQPLSGRAPSPQLTYEGLIAALAQRLLPEAVDLPFERRLVQVRQQLKAAPHLVIVDNLEAQDDTAYLLAHLNDLAAPSKFLLTARTRPPEQAAVYPFLLEELAQTDADALLRHHAGEIGVPALAEAGEGELAAIFEVTGGNPLALKLVASLLDVMPLAEALAGLKQSRPGPIEDLYRHIYWKSWHSLGAEARTLLQAMPLIAETGGTPAYLRTISGLEESELWPAIQELRRRSLLEIRGNLQEKRYGIHRLTDTFLRTEIIHWPLEGAEA